MTQPAAPVWHWKAFYITRGDRWDTTLPANIEAWTKTLPKCEPNCSMITIPPWGPDNLYCVLIGIRET